MRFRRLNIRSIMTIVAVVALTIAASGWMKHARAYRDNAWWHAVRAERLRTDLPRLEEIHRYDQSHPDELRLLCGSAPRALSPERARSSIAYHESLRRKYEHAARYPWLGVEPDPPPPR